MLGLRGARGSEPVLACPGAVHEFVRAELGAPTREQAVQAQAAAIDTCMASLGDRGIDLGAFSTLEAAHDLRDLRVALGVPLWTVFGVSYGSRLAQVAAAIDPEGVHAIVLDAPAPLDVPYYGAWRDSFRAALGRLSADCQADERCRSLGVDVVEAYESAAAGESVEARRVRVVVRSALYGPASRTLPLALHELARGNTTPMVAMAAQWEHHAASYNFGLWWVLQGNDQGAPDSYEQWREAIADDPASDEGPASIEAEARVVGDWELVRSGLPPMSTNTPTLALTGAYDPITPHEHGVHVAGQGPLFHAVAFPNVGHGVLKYRCPVQIAAAFVDEPAIAPTTACVAEMEKTLDMATQGAGEGRRPGFLVDVHRVQWLPRLAMSLQRGPSARGIGLLACGVVLCTILGWPVAWGIARVRKATRDASLRKERLVAVAMFASVVLLVAGLAAGVRGTPPDALPFGLEPAYAWVPYLWAPPVLLAVGLAALAFAAHRAGRGAVSSRVHLALLSASSLVFVCLGLLA